MPALRKQDPDFRGKSQGRQACIRPSMCGECIPPAAGAPTGTVPSDVTLREEAFPRGGTCPWPHSRRLAVLGSEWSLCRGCVVLVAPARPCPGSGCQSRSAGGEARLTRQASSGPLSRVSLGGSSVAAGPGAAGVFACVSAPALQSPPPPFLLCTCTAGPPWARFRGSCSSRQSHGSHVLIMSAVAVEAA